jgi:multidrug resistance efflux pump
MFRSPQPGQEVMLCEEEGQVRFFSVAEPSPLVGRVRDLERSMATRDEELKRLRGTVNTARRVLAEAEALSGQLDEARSELNRRDQTLAELHQRLESLEQAQPTRRRRRGPS